MERLCFSFSIVQCSICISRVRYILRQGKNEETKLSSLQAYFVIPDPSGDFIVKNNCNHHLIFTLQICIIGMAINYSALLNCYAVTLCFCVLQHIVMNTLFFPYLNIYIHIYIYIYIYTHTHMYFHFLRLGYCHLKANFPINFKFCRV